MEKQRKGEWESSRTGEAENGGKGDAWLSGSIAIKS